MPGKRNVHTKTSHKGHQQRKTGLSGKIPILVNLVKNVLFIERAVHLMFTFKQEGAPEFAHHALKTSLNGLHILCHVQIILIIIHFKEVEVWVLTFHI